MVKNSINQSLRSHPLRLPLACDDLVVTLQIIICTNRLFTHSDIIEHPDYIHK